MKTKVSRRKVGLLVAGLLLVLAPAGALAQTPCAAGTALEVLESPPYHAAPGGPTFPGAFSPGIGAQLGGLFARIAQATEVGELAGVCGGVDLTGPVEIQAQSRIPVTGVTVGGEPILGSGTFSGVGRIDTSANGVVVVKLDGTITFVPGAPIAQILGGSWSTLGKNRTTGTFDATAFVPVPLGCTLENGGCFYFVPGVGLVPLDPDTEYSKQHGTGLANFVITLWD